MGESPKAISSRELHRLVGSSSCPLIFDLRREAAYAQAEDVIPTARWREHQSAGIWGVDLPRGADVVVYCVHGHQVSQAASAHLRAMGLRTRYLEGGVEAYRAAGGLLIRKDALPDRVEEAPSRWITRERPKIDRIACPWFIRRFVDRDALVHFVSPEWVKEAAAELDATPFDIPDVAFSHHGELCSFDAFLARFGVADPALGRLAAIVRGADTGRLDLAPQAAGLLAMSLGLSAIEGDDHAMLEKGLVVYDALYGWCRFAAEETHGWPPAATDGNRAAGDAR
ncbi:MAG: chromate resistance protein ChrB domain-containing protein [Planctomycetota bacterium]|jgi:rhodanese-related sulfurtransferase